MDTYTHTHDPAPLPTTCKSYVHVHTYTYIHQILLLANDMQVTDLALIWWALAKLNLRTDSELYEAMSAKVLAELPAANAQDVSNILW